MLEVREAEGQETLVVWGVGVGPFGLVHSHGHQLVQPPYQARDRMINLRIGATRAVFG